MKFTRIIFIVLIVALLLYLFKRHLSEKESFEDENTNATVEANTSGEDIGDQDDSECEVDEEGNCVEEDVDDQAEESDDQEDEAQFDGVEDDSSLENKERKQLIKAGIDGEVSFRRDPVHVGDTVKGVIEKVPRKRLNEYIKLFREPDSYNTTQYETTKCVLETREKNYDKDDCYNEDITNNFRKGKCIPRPNMLQCDAMYRDDLMDPADYYRKVFRPVETSMSDSILKGHNYNMYSSFLKPQELHKKLFDKDEYNVPRGVSYAFMHTPSYE